MLDGREEFLKIDGRKVISIPILKEYRGGLRYSITAVADGRVHRASGIIDVPWGDRVDVEYLRFNKHFLNQIGMRAPI